MTTNETKNSPLKYSDAGVDIDAGDALISDIKPHAARTARAGSNPDLGGFGGLFDLKAAGFSDPVLVAATDGVGTKLEIAQTIGIHRGLGTDLVAMCVNDILAQGALPLFFLDYFATGVLDRAVAADVVAGVADGCLEAGCALIGGETAEMPGLYPQGSYDLAGFCVGAAERGTLLSSDLPKAGDIVFAFASSGIHSNGFSLVRKIIAREALDFKDVAPFASHMKLGEALIAPTRIYTDSVAAAMKTGGVTGVAHITGGGLIKNPPRIYTDAFEMRLDMHQRPLPPVFQWLKQCGELSNFELAQTFNCGIGMLISVTPKKADEVMAAVRVTGEDIWQAGSIYERSGDDAVILENCASAWA